MQSEFNCIARRALHLHDLTNLKQEFKQTKISKLNKYTIKMTY